MRAWDQLIESRIREWQARKERGEETAPPPDEPVDSLESQLFADVVGLRRQALSESDPGRRQELLGEAERLRIRLAVLLEQHGLNLLAGSLDQRIAAELRAAKED